MNEFYRIAMFLFLFVPAFASGLFADQSLTDTDVKVVVGNVQLERGEIARLTIRIINSSKSPIFLAQWSAYRTPYVRLEVFKEGQGWMPMSPGPKQFSANSIRVEAGDVYEHRPLVIDLKGQLSANPPETKYRLRLSFYRNQEEWSRHRQFVTRVQSETSRSDVKAEPPEASIAFSESFTLPSAQ